MRRLLPAAVSLAAARSTLSKIKAVIPEHAANSDDTLNSNVSAAAGSRIEGEGSRDRRHETAR